MIENHNKTHLKYTDTKPIEVNKKKKVVKKVVKKKKKSTSSSVVNQSEAIETLPDVDQHVPIEDETLNADYEDAAGEGLGLFQCLLKKRKR